MSKQEFIDKLRLALSGRVSASLVEENVAYYEEYINTQMRLGNDEATILSSLGDPRLIAKSIITANNGENSSDTTADSGQERYYDNDTRYYAEKSRSGYLKVVKVPGWVWLLVVLLIVVLVISAVFSLVSALLPIVLPVLIVLFLIKLFRDWLN
ncbi:MAG: hypothetical protein IJ379_01755 [Lachnospiraceae bacterium]|nr:hypothetical protein [Lachnospiraceae bacterium]